MRHILRSGHTQIFMGFAYYGLWLGPIDIPKRRNKQLFYRRILFQRIQTHLWSFYNYTFEKDGRLLGAR